MEHLIMLLAPSGPTSPPPLGPWETITRSQLRTIPFGYIEVFYDRQRHEGRLGDRTPGRGLRCQGRNLCHQPVNQRQAI
jgi:hypothetical protein